MGAPHEHVELARWRRGRYAPTRAAQEGRAVGLPGFVRQLLIAAACLGCSGDRDIGARRPSSNAGGPPPNFATSSTVLSTGAMTGSIQPPDGRGGMGGSTAGLAPPCPGCSNPICPSGSRTVISGTVYAPNGSLPIYDAIVYVPSEPLQPLASGVSCDQCGKLNSATVFTSALSDATGRFVLDAPAGANVPLVLQVGKWRRSVRVADVRACADNHLTDPDLTRLPKNRTEGDMPRIAVTTGEFDNVACLLPKVGIDRSEFGVAGDDKAVTFYYTQGAGGPAGMQHARKLWDDVNELKKYDMVIFSCEGGEEVPTSKDDVSFAAVRDYLDSGGRLFTTHFMYTWYKYSPSPEMRLSATFDGSAMADRTVVLDTSFPKGRALADWLAHVKPDEPYGRIAFAQAYDDYVAVDPAAAQVWGRGEQLPPLLGPPSFHPRFITTNTPVGRPPSEQCGKGVQLDAHIISIGAMGDVVDATFPEGCKTKPTPGEHAFSFFFFDLSSCIQKEDAPVAPPPPPPR